MKRRCNTKDRFAGWHCRRIHLFKAQSTELHNVRERGWRFVYTGVGEQKKQKKKLWSVCATREKYILYVGVLMSRGVSQLEEWSCCLLWWCGSRYFCICCQMAAGGADGGWGGCSFGLTDARYLLHFLKSITLGCLVISSCSYWWVVSRLRYSEDCCKSARSGQYVKYSSCRAFCTPLCVAHLRCSYMKKKKKKKVVGGS